MILHILCCGVGCGCGIPASGINAVMLSVCDCLDSDVAAGSVRRLDTRWVMTEGARFGKDHPFKLCTMRTNISIDKVCINTRTFWCPRTGNVSHLLK